VLPLTLVVLFGVLLVVLSYREVVSVYTRAGGSCLGNLRGIREAGRVFAAPTYLFAGSVIVMITRQ
jgi:amino acid transporter